MNLICGSSLTAVTGCRKNPQRKERSVETETARKQQTYVTFTCTVNIERCQHRDVLCYKETSYPCVCDLGFCVISSLYYHCCHSYSILELLMLAKILVVNFMEIND